MLVSFQLVSSTVKFLYFQVNLLDLTATATAKSLQLCPTVCDPIEGSPQSMGFPRQEHWSGLPFPSPIHESEK